MQLGSLADISQQRNEKHQNEQGSQQMYMALRITIPPQL
jgi:hypothetical protein